jgi:protein-S-isoprenylcysteine O-methyltransferase Ste14
MDLLPTFRLGLMNAWWLILPLVLTTVYICAMKKELARRMSDMTGYDAGERIFTVSASFAPYPFMIATVWTPFTTLKPVLYPGLALYLMGAVLFFTTLRVFVATPLDRLFSAGPYRISRNPFYVAVTLMFLGICVATMNLILLAWLLMMCMPQHFMILAEERHCREKFGEDFVRYMGKVPRYLLM